MRSFNRISTAGAALGLICLSGAAAAVEYPIGQPQLAARLIRTAPVLPWRHLTAGIAVLLAILLAPLILGWQFFVW